jgi:hypothetical protein
MIFPVVVEVNSMKPFTHASPRLGELRRGSCKWLFYWVYDYTRGHHPPLENVDATDSDKRDELALCLLGEHPSGSDKSGLTRCL